MNKWIFVGSFGAVFLITLVFSYGPGYGGSLLAFLGNNITGSPEMSPSDMVTPVVTPKQVVTFKSVTNVTSVSPVMSPLIYSDGEDYSASSSMLPVPSLIPTVSPIPSATLTVSPSVVTPYPVAPSLTLTPSPTQISISPQSTKININTADLIELDKIPEVGPATALSIVAYRTANGSFQKIEDIMMVKGIKDATFQKMKDYITI